MSCVSKKLRLEQDRASIVLSPHETHEEIVALIKTTPIDSNIKNRNISFKEYSYLLTLKEDFEFIIKSKSLDLYNLDVYFNVPKLISDLYNGDQLTAFRNIKAIVEEYKNLHCLYLLAYCFECGLGCYQNQVLSYKIHKLLANKGYPLSLREISLAYQIGRFGVRDYDKASYFEQQSLIRKEFFTPTYYHSFRFAQGGLMSQRKMFQCLIFAQQRGCSAAVVHIRELCNEILKLVHYRDLTGLGPSGDLAMLGLTVDCIDHCGHVIREAKHNDGNFVLRTRYYVERFAGEDNVNKKHDLARNLLLEQFSSPSLLIEVANRYEQGLSSQVDLLMALELWIRVLDNDSNGQCFLKFVDFIKRNNEALKAQLVNVYRRFEALALNQDPKFIYLMGVLNKHGIGCERNVKKAIEYFSLSEQLGSFIAKDALFKTYSGFDQYSDYTLAKKYLNELLDISERRFKFHQHNFLLKESLVSVLDQLNVQPVNPIASCVFSYVSCPKVEDISNFLILYKPSFTSSICADLSQEDNEIGKISHLISEFSY